MESHHAFSTYASTKNRLPIFPLHGMYKCHLINKKPINTTLSQQTIIIDGALFSFKGKFILYIYHIRNSLRTFLFKLWANITSLKSRKTPKEFGRKWSQLITRDNHHDNQDPHSYLPLSLETCLIMTYDMSHVLYLQFPHSIQV